MAHTYTKNLLHCVFSKKNRKPLIPSDRLGRLWAYMFGISKNLHFNMIAAGWTENHVHFLLALLPTITRSEAIQKLKGNSSRWMGTGFSWQQGYGAFSIGASQLATVKAYIANQAVHHKQMTFEDEHTGLLKRYGVAYDPEHVFD